MSLARRWIADLERLWIDPESPDVRDARMTPLFELWRAEPDFLLAFAGERGSMIRRHEVLGVLSGSRFRALLREAASRETTSDAESRRFVHFDALMGARHVLAPPPPQTAARVREMASSALALAIEALVEAAPWRESWELQRRGLFGSPPLVGHTFQRATILGALASCGRPLPGEVRALVAEADPELRYYGTWRGIPPDADDVAAFLILAARGTKGLRRKAEVWLRMVEANVRDDGTIPTWLYRGADVRGGPDGPWPGDDCATVRARLLTALLTFDPARFGPRVEAGVARLLEAPGAGAYHSTPEACRAAFLALAGVYGGAKKVEVEAAARDLTARIAGEQQLDGGWGSPLRTAEHLIALAGRAIEPLRLLRGMRYLREHQRPDGSWPAEDQYPIPLPDRRVGRHGGRAMTTARCAEALRASLRATGAEGSTG